MNTQSPEALRDEVRRRYAEAALAAAAGSTATCCADSCCTPEAATEEIVRAAYTVEERGELPEAATLASLGCGNPTAVAELNKGETVLDLGSGGGIDVILSAKRVGPGGIAYGLDMTDEMLGLAQANAREAGMTNVHFLKGEIEAVSVDKPAVFIEMARVLRPAGRIGISDIVAEDRLSASERAERGSYVGCIAGALSKGEYEAGLEAAGFEGVVVAFTHEVGDGMHSAIIKARKPL